MNSRSARNEISAEQHVRHASPDDPADPEHDRHDPGGAQQVADAASSRARPRRGGVARSRSDSSKADDADQRPAGRTRSGTAARPAGSAVRLRRNWFIGIRRRAAPSPPSRARSRKARRSSPGSSAHRRAEGDRAQDRHRHHLALGHHALHVVDPGRHQHHVAGTAAPGCTGPLLNGCGSARCAARAFGKDDDRVAAGQRLDQRLQRVLRRAVRWRGLDVDGVEDLAS